MIPDESRPERGTLTKQENSLRESLRVISGWRRDTFTLSPEDAAVVVAAIDRLQSDYCAAQDCINASEQIECDLAEAEKTIQLLTDELAALRSSAAFEAWWGALESDPQEPRLRYVNGKHTVFVDEAWAIWQAASVGRNSGASVSG